MANNRGISINEDGSYSLTKSRKIKKSYVILEQEVVAKDVHAAKCKFRALNCPHLNDE